MRKLLLCLAILLLPSLCLSAEIVPFPDNIAVNIAPLQSKFDTDDAILIEVTFTNTSEDALRFLVWGTPFEGRINGDIFDVRLENGSPLPYVGRIYKRGKPIASDYKTLAVGESIKSVVDLFDAYDMSAAGSYSVQYTNKGLHGKRSNAQLRQTGSTTFIIEDSGKYRLFKQTPDFSSCSSGEQSLLNSALSNAESLSRTARDDLQNTPSSFREGAPRSTVWFGAYAETRYSRVLSNFEKIYSAARNQTMEFDCSCNESAYAYVYPHDHYSIYLCNAFWGAPMTGTDSKAGTLIHELSHFHILSSTTDHVYGQSGAKSLAINSPYLAIENADNHEYFAENTPFLSMPTGVSIPLAVDNTTLSYSTGGAQPFFGQTTTFKVGGDAAQSGDIANNQYSYFRTTLPENSRLTFYWKVSSEVNKDYLEFRVNGKVMQKISGTTNWEKKTFLLKGKNNVEWRYTKNSSVSMLDDAGWVDNITVQEARFGANSPILELLLNEDK